MGSFENLSGKKYNFLTAIERVFKNNNRTYWECKCDCGNNTVVEAYALKTGTTKTCGKCEICKSLQTTHALSSHRVYGVWKSMRQRCNSESVKYFHNYGGRGISVCSRWEESFEAFVEDMGIPEKGMTLERIDNDGNYTPENCRWATRQEQARNMRKNRLLTVYGMTKNLFDWSWISGTPVDTIRNRIKKGWTHKQCVFGMPKA